MDALERIHDTSLRILRAIGIKLFHPQVLDIVREKGIKVSGATAFFLTLALHALPSLLPNSLHVAQARPLFHSSRRLAQPRRGKSF